MTTRVPIRYGGTGANTAEAARTSLGAAPSIAYDQANTAYGQANAARSDANTTFAAINTTFGTVNTNITTANSQANLAYAQANAAIAAANNANLLLGGVITGTLNVTQDIIVGGNVYLEGNTTFINVATYAVEDSLIYLASNNQLTDSVDIGFMGGKNTGGTYAHTGFVRDATDAKWKLFDGLPEEGHVGNVVDFNNTYLATLVANVEANTLSVVNGVSGNVNFDSGTLFVDSVGNRIGVGTTTPSKSLHTFSSSESLLVDGSATWGGALQIKGGGGANTWQIQSTGTGAGEGANKLIFVQKDAAITAMAINSVGNVGIGATNPAARLDIGSGNLNFSSTGQRITGNFSDATPTNRVMFQTNVLNSGTGIAAMTNGTGSSASWRLYGSSDPNNASVGDINITSTEFLIRSFSSGTGTTQPMNFSVGGTTRQMAITSTVLSTDSSVNVGIGTTNPGYKLDVNGIVNIAQGSYLRKAFADNTEEFLIRGDATVWNGFISYTPSSGTSNRGFKFGAWDNVGFRNDWVTFWNGNVGIGTTIPGYTLDLAGGTTVNQRLQLRRGSDDTNQHMRIGWDRIESIRSSVALSSPQTTLSFNQVGSDGTRTNMFIDTIGNVGIGITTPGAKLTVSGEVRINSSGAINTHLNYLDGGDNYISMGNAGATYFRNSSATLMTILGSGAVGIGTNSPTAKLSVRGTTDFGDSHDSTTSSLHTTRLSGYALRYDASSRYGNYGVLIFSASTGWTTSAKRFMITNGIGANKFCIIRSVDALTDPTLGDAGSITSGTADFTIDSSGNVGVGTSSPTSRLTISTSGADGIQLTADGGISNRLFFTHSGGSGTGVTLLGANSRTEGALRFFTGATPGANSGGQRIEFSMTGIGLGGTASPPDGVGIAFPASQSASSDANTLDDYEEGTWTPELRDGGTVLTQSYSYRSGVYHKIGRMVHIHFGFLLSSLSGTSTNVLSVYGLPFVGATTGGYQEPMGYAIMGNQPTASHSNAVYFFNVSGTSILQARLLTGSDTVFTSDNIDGNTFMKFSMIYWV